jgi:hypothetical protein
MPLQCKVKLIASFDSLGGSPPERLEFLCSRLAPLETAPLVD